MRNLEIVIGTAGLVAVAYLILAFVSLAFG